MSVAAALVAAISLAGCGSTTYFAGRTLPPSGLQYRVLIAVQHPTAFGHVLQAVDLAVRGTTEIVVAGHRPDLVAAVRARFLPNAVLAWGERGDGPLWEGRDDGRAYVCRSYACQLPADTPEALAPQLVV